MSESLKNRGKPGHRQQLIISMMFITKRFWHVYKFNNTIADQLSVCTKDY